MNTVDRGTGQGNPDRSSVFIPGRLGLATTIIVSSLLLSSCTGESTTGTTPADTSTATSSDHSYMDGNPKIDSACTPRTLDLGDTIENIYCLNTSGESVNIPVPECKGNSQATLTLKLDSIETNGVFHINGHEYNPYTRLHSPECGDLNGWMTSTEGQNGRAVQIHHTINKSPDSGVPVNVGNKIFAKKSAFRNLYSAR